eukprot:5646272-Pyramimonas_sp.AAC.1
MQTRWSGSTPKASTVPGCSAAKPCAASATVSKVDPTSRRPRVIGTISREVRSKISDALRKLIYPTAVASEKTRHSRGPPDYHCQRRLQPTEPGP